MRNQTENTTTGELQNLEHILDDFAFSEEDLARMSLGIEAGVNPADIFGFTDAELENYYTLAYQHYTAGNFEDARKVFEFLCRLKNFDVRYWMGLAGCRQGMGQYKDAIDAYTMAAAAESFSSPLPFLQIAMCFVLTNEKANAGTVLDALLIMGDALNPTHAACHDKARQMLQLLNA